MSYFIEVTAFTLMAVFIARLGAVPVAGHQITANVGTVLYMLPLSIASATSTLVAQAIGGGNMQEAKKIGRAGIRLAVSLSVVIGVIVWFLREHIIRAYTPDPVIVGAALPLFLYIAFYQLFDSMQVTTAFVLRAYKVAVVPTVIYAVTCGAWAWAAAICWDSIRWAWTPAALRGPAGFWLANSLSLGMVAVGLLAYLRVIQRRAAAANSAFEQAAGGEQIVIAGIDQAGHAGRFAGRPSRKPCTWSQCSSCSSRSCPSVSTPSATTSICSACASAMMAATMARPE
jgi:MATE family multidrug resistance protein